MHFLHTSSGKHPSKSIHHFAPPQEALAQYQTKIKDVKTIFTQVNTNSLFNYVCIIFVNLIIPQWPIHENVKEMFHISHHPIYMAISVHKQNTLVTYIGFYSQITQKFHVFEAIPSSREDMLIMEQQLSFPLSILSIYKSAMQRFSK